MGGFIVVLQSRLAVEYNGSMMEMLYAVHSKGQGAYFCSWNKGKHGTLLFS